MVLALRLLTCARMAYNVAKNSAPVPGVFAVGKIPAADALGWSFAPVGFVAGDQGQDRAFVGVNSDGIVISIKGTTPLGDGTTAQFLADWLGDFAAPLIPADGYPGLVHLGFHAAAARLTEAFRTLLTSLVAAHPALPIVVTGHSKGAAVAPLIAWWLHVTFPGRAIIVQTFAPARVGDRDFADAYNAVFPNHARYEYGDDIVPHVPLSGPVADALAAMTVFAPLVVAGFDYGAVGRLAYINDNGSICGDSEGLEISRAGRLLAKLIEPGGVGYVAACHGIDGPNGYAAADYGMAA